MAAPRILALVPLALAVAHAPAARAQTIRPLIRTAEVLSGLGDVRAVEEVRLYGSASGGPEGWSVRARTGALWSPTRALVRNGVIDLIEGQPLGALPGASLLWIEESRRVPDGSSVAILGMSGMPDPLQDHGLFVDDVPVVLEGEVVTPSNLPASELLAFHQLWPNGEDAVLAHVTLDEPTLAGADEEALLVLRHDGSGGLVSSQARFITLGVLPGTTYQLRTIFGRPQSVDFDDDEHVLAVCDVYANDHETVLYLDHNLLAVEGEPSPVAGYDWGSFAESSVALGPGGAVAVRTAIEPADGASMQALLVGATLFAREGDPVPALPGATWSGFGDAPLLFAADGSLAWYGEWDGPDAGAGVFVDGDLVVRTGHALGARTIESFRPRDGGLDRSADGLRFAFLAELDDGTKGAYVLRLDRGGDALCVGDGSGAACPCGNVSAIGADAGCRNSLGAGAVLGAVGTVDVAADDLKLVARGVPAGQPGVFLEGDPSAGAFPFRDGILCVGLGAQQLEFAFADAAGVARGAQPVTTTGSAQPGSTSVYQLWYRDPVVSVCGTGSSTSAALELDW